MSEVQRNKRVAQELPDGRVALTTVAPGMTLEPIGSMNQTDNINQPTFDALHKQLQTGHLKFATVKEILDNQEQR